VIETALEDVQDRKAGWNEAVLTRAINAALPGYPDTPDGAQVAQLLDQLTAEALRYVTPLDAPRLGDKNLPPELRLAYGDSVYQAPGCAPVRYVRPRPHRTRSSSQLPTWHRSRAV